MKIKNLNIVERHVEKLVLAVAVVFCFSVVWFYVLDDPYSISVGTDPHVTPNEIEQKVVAQERTLNRLIGPGTPSPLPEMTVPAYTSVFRRRIKRPPLTADRFDPLGPPGLAYGQFRLPDRPHDDVFDVPLPPPPVWLSEVTGFGVLPSHHELADYFNAQGYVGFNQRRVGEYGEEVAKAYDALVPHPSPPRDFRYVSVGAIYDVDAWRQKLLHSNHSIPEDWWRQTTMLTDVVLERQTFDPVKGHWGPVGVIPPLPGSMSFRDSPADWTKDDARWAIETLAEYQDQIARPSFVPMTDAVVWKKPEVQPGGVLLHGLHQKIEAIANDVEQLKDQIRQAPSDTGGQSSGTIFDLRDPGEARRGKPIVAELKTEIEKKTKQREDLLEQIRVLSKQEFNPAELNNLSNQGWKIWAHDVSVQPGQTYRYRMRAWVVNPLFQRSQLVAQQRQAYFHKLALESEVSLWTGPVTLEPPYRFFIVGGSSVERLATVEVWRVINGYPRKAEFRVQPGDFLGGVVSMDVGDQTIDADMRVGVIVIDLVEVPSKKNVGGKTTQMLYVELGSGKLLEHTIEEDRYSPIRDRLMGQSLPSSAVAGGADAVVGLE